MESDSTRQKQKLSPKIHSHLIKVYKSLMLKFMSQHSIFLLTVLSGSINNIDSI